MQLPELEREIISFLISLDHVLYDSESQRAFIYRAQLEPDLFRQIEFGHSVSKFVLLLVCTLVDYGQLVDGRHSLEAVLEAAASYVGQDKRRNCERLIQAVHDNAATLSCLDFKCLSNIKYQVPAIEIFFADIEKQQCLPDTISIETSVTFLI